MTVKAKLIQKISSIENESHLEALLKYLEESVKKSIHLTEDDIKEIEISNNQLKNGKYVTHLQ